MVVSGARPGVSSILGSAALCAVTARSSVHVEAKLRAQGTSETMMLEVMSFQ
jgi:hypothetical protein